MHIKPTNPLCFSFFFALHRIFYSWFILQNGTMRQRQFFNTPDERFVFFLLNKFQFRTWEECEPHLRVIWMLMQFLGNKKMHFPQKKLLNFHQKFKKRPKILWRLRDTWHHCWLIFPFYLLTKCNILYNYQFENIIEHRLKWSNWGKQPNVSYARFSLCFKICSFNWLELLW